MLGGFTAGQAPHNSSKQPIFGLTHEWFRELSFSRIDVESTSSYTFPVQTGGIFTSLGIDTR